MQGNSWPKIIRDPVHNIISFENNSCDRLLLKLINTKEFQRLRRIKQLGMCDLVFPGATHSRFAHSIGVMHIAKMILARLNLEIDINENHKCATLAAALLHDIGHGPFSHAFEKVIGKRHEDRTREIIIDNTTEINRVLKHKNGDEFPKQVASFFRSVDDFGIPQYLTQIVSSQLDADRFDYLLRDSHATGTNYGNFDLHWLIEHLYVDKNKERLYLGRKAFSATVEYLFARFHMYQTVYFHKATRAAEIMLRLILERYKELLEKTSEKHDKERIAPDVPATLERVFSKDAPLQDFLTLDDSTVSEFFKACCNSSDNILKILGEGLMNRKLYKCTDTADTDPSEVAEFKSKGDELLKRENINLKYFFVADTAADTPYKPYDSDSDEPATQIFIKKQNNKQVDIKTLSDPVLHLTKTYKLLRYYYPEKYRQDIRKI